MRYGPGKVLQEGRGLPRVTFEEWWESNFDWLDPPHAELSGLLTLALLITVGTLVAAYAIAWWWHRHKDPQGRTD